MKLKKLLFLLFATLAFSVGWAGTFVKVKNLSELKPDGHYIIAYQNGTKDFTAGQLHFLNDRASSNWNDSFQQVYSSASYTYVPDVINTDILDNATGSTTWGPTTIFTIGGDETNGWTFHTTGVACGDKGALSGYLSMDPNNSTPNGVYKYTNKLLGLRDKAPANWTEWERKKSTWDLVEENGGLIFKNRCSDESTSYYIQYYSGSKCFQLRSGTSYPRAYLFMEKEVPSMNADVPELQIAFNKEKTFNVNGKNLTNNIVISKDDPYGMFIVTPSTIMPNVSGEVDQVVTVKYVGAATWKNNFSCTLNLNCSDLDAPVEIALYGHHPTETFYETAGDYYIKNKGSNAYLNLAGAQIGTVAATQEDADLITLGFASKAIKTMSQTYGDISLTNAIAALKTKITTALNGADFIFNEGSSRGQASLVNKLTTLKMIDCGDGYVNIVIDLPDEPADANFEAIKEYLLANVDDPLIGYISSLTTCRRNYLVVTNNSIDFSLEESDAAKWKLEEYVAPVDDLFTTAGDYYVSNKGNNKYVVIDAENYDATASVDKENADIVTISFNEDGTVNTMKQKDGDGDLIAILDRVKSELKTRLDANGYNSEFLEDMFKIKLVKTGDTDGSMYFCFDIPRIENITAVRNYLLNEAGLPAKVTGYLETLLQPGKRVYLNITNANGIFGFTKDKAAATSKWMVEEYKDNLFTTPGDYYVSNKGNSKYVVIDAENYNATASVDKEDADVVSISFNEDGTVNTMKQKDGEGDMIAILDQVKSELRNRIPDDINTNFLDEMFKIRLIESGDSDGSIFFCFDIPSQIDRLAEILAVVNNINNDRVKDYLNKLLQPGKRIYLCINDLQQGDFNFTEDKTDTRARWMVEEYIAIPDEFFNTPGDYLVSNKGNSKYVVIDAENYYAEASADKDNADVVTLDFEGNEVTTMVQKDGTGNMLAILERVKSELRNRLPEDINTDFLEEMFKIKLIKTGDEDGSIYFCFDIPKRINDLDRIIEVVNNINNETVKDYLNKLLQPGKRIYLCVNVENNKSFTFTQDKNLEYAKWMVEKSIFEKLFATEGYYYVSNKGNNKYVVVTGEYEASASVDKDDADVLTITFNDDKSVKTMTQKDGEGDLTGMLETLKEGLKNRLPEYFTEDILNEMFKIWLAETGDEDGSIYFCFNIPANLDAEGIKASDAYNNLPAKVLEYLPTLLQPGKLVYLNIKDDAGNFSFTDDKEPDASKWMVEKYETVDDGKVVIYFDQETADQYDYTIITWDGTEGNRHYYFGENGIKVKSLPKEELGTSGKKKVYKFAYGLDAKDLGLIMTNGEHSTEEITPKAHEIYYYYCGDTFTMNDVERNDPYLIGVPIDEVIFPDEGLRFFISARFRNKEHINYDTNKNNGDKVLEPFEIDKIDYLGITNGLSLDIPIKSFEGIQYFTKLKEVVLSTNDNVDPCFDFEVLDLTMCNDGLEKVSVRGASQMTTFELPENHPLRVLSLEKCEAMPVGTLNERLTTYSKTLEELYLSTCSNFNELNIKQNGVLKVLHLSNVPIPELDLSGNPVLEDLRIGGTDINNSVSAEIADKSELKKLYVGNNSKLTEQTLDVSKNTKLEYLQVYHQHNYETIDVSGTNVLKYMSIHENNALSTLTLPVLKAMEEMWIEKNPSLEAQTIDLSGNTSLLQISVNQNGAKSTIKGMSNAMSELRYISTEGQLYDRNVLDLDGCTKLHNLDVMNCNLDRISVAGCTALGSKALGNQNTGFYVNGNHLRALDLEGVDLDYNFNVSPRYEKLEGSDTYDYTLDGINKYFMPENYMYHAGYNSQSVPTIKPRVGYVFHEYYNTGEGTNSYTYMVYVSLASGGEVSEQDTDQSGKAVLSLNDLFRNWRAEGMADELPQSEYDGQTDEELVEQLSAQVADSRFDHNRVKLWKRFSENHPNTITTVARHGKGDELVYVHGTKGATTNSVRPRGAHEDPADWEINPAEVKGDILVLGVYTVPVGVNEAVVSGKVSYLYGTRSDEADPEVENGDFVAESEETNFYKSKTLTDYNAAANTATGVNSAYDNTFPVEFKWEAKLTDKPEEIITNIEDLKLDLNREVAKVSYVNLMGVESDRPFEGVNIVVTRYTDGSVTTTKVIK